MTTADQTGHEHRDDADASVNPATPPDRVIDRPPTETSIQRLPFGELTWENFERLCHRLAGLTDGVEHHVRYTRAGQAQESIDVFVRLAGGSYEVWQVKQYKAFASGDLDKAIAAFRAGSWAGRSAKLSWPSRATRPT